MKKSLMRIRKQEEQHSKSSALFSEFILGGQDGLVNVLGVILGIAIATNDPRIVIVAGLAAAFAESFSMAAVAFTSAKASADYYESEKEKELYEIRCIPEKEKEEVYDIFHKKGFRGKLLNDIVKHIISSKKRWVDIMMKEELNLSKSILSPAKSALIVGLATVIGSAIPVVSFFFLPVMQAIFLSIALSAVALFITGALEAKATVGNWVSKGFQLVVIGMMAAGIGFIVGKLFGAS